MKLEDALTALRAGAKIYHPSMEKNEYFIGCYHALPDFYDDEGNLVTETFEQKKERGMFITKMIDEKVHPDMCNRLSFKKYMELIDEFPFLQEKLAFPTINLLWLMSDAWEIKE